MDAKDYIEIQAEYFKKYARTTRHLLGIELEYFLTDRNTHRSYSYFEPDGTRHIIERLADKNWNTIIEEGGYTLGLEKDENTITFEPGGQLEISIKPLENIEEIEEANKSILSDISRELKEGQALVSASYHPKTRISELPILPKKRYHMMFEYFKGHGRLSHYMMKGTAATQVSIDYSDEDDFIRKFRVANFISPVLSDIFDSTVIFEGEIYNNGNLRKAIWNETDRQRSSLVPGSLDKIFGFREYAQYLLNVPPIFIKKDGKAIYTGDKKLKDIIGDYTFSETELEHILSMVFPDIRLKKFIELRMADALPYPYCYAAACIIKAVFFTQKIIDALYEKSLSYRDSWVERQNTSLAENPSSVDDTFLELKDYIIKESPRVLSCDELNYLNPFLDIIYADKSVSNQLKNLYREDIKAFYRAIEVPRF